ncbi:MAG: TolC family protein [Caldimicrobium sp.]
MAEIMAGKKFFYFRLILVVFFILNAFKMGFSKEVLTLKDAIERALKANPQITIAIKQKEEFFFQKNLIRAEFFPKLYLSYTFQRVDQGKGRPTSDTHLFGPTLNWNIFSGFSTYHSFKESLYYISSQDEAIRQKILEVALAVVSAYVDYFKQKALLEAALADLEDAKIILKLATKRYEIGLSPYADVLDAEARLKEAEYKVTNYKYTEDIAKAKVLLLLNEDLQKLDNYEFLPLEEKELEISPLSELINKALTLRPEIAFKEKEILAQKERIKSVRGEYFPTIDLFTSYYRSDKSFFPDRDYQFLAGIKINFPLFTGFSTPSKLQKERATLEKKNTEKRALELNIQEEVFSALKQFLTTKENLISAQAMLEKLKEDYRLIQKRYENGLASIVDLTTTMARLSQARTQVALAQYEIFFKYYQLKKVIGEIPGL